MEKILEGEKVKTIIDFHRHIKEVLKFPDYYGENLDALWDCLTGYIELPVTVVWNNFETSKHSLGNYTEKILDIFSDEYLLKRGFIVKYH